MIILRSVLLKIKHSGAFKLRCCVWVYFIACFNVSMVYAHATNEANVSIMTFNIENGGTQVDFRQVVNAIKQANADVVGIQEAWGNLDRLAHALKWKYYDPYLHVVSRFPLFKIKSQHKYTFIEITPQHFVAITNIHLPDESYGPDLIRQGVDEKTVVANEKKTRLSEAKGFIDALAHLAKHDVPVFLTGDFNCPSHMDWTKSTVHKQRNHRYVMIWPVTEYASKQGLMDSYRERFPDPYKNPGFTWPAKRPTLKYAIDGYNPTAHDLPDRIDLIFFAGPARVMDSQLVGEKSGLNVNIKTSPWPSDHRAVVSQFKVTPSHYPLEQMKLIPIVGEYKKKKPQIMASQNTINVGEPIKITWKHAPGYQYDYISIMPIEKTQAAKNSQETVHLYTRGKINGTIEYGDINAKGSWLDWHKTDEGRWPLKPGHYRVNLMLDDGRTLLATTTINIVPSQ